MSMVPKGFFRSVENKESSHKPAAWDRWSNVNKIQGENRTSSLQSFSQLSEEKLLKLESRVLTVRWDLPFENL